MNRRTIDVVVYQDGKAWVATALNVGVSSCGDTRDEALEAIREALDMYFEEMDAEVADVTKASIERLLV